MPRRPVVVDPWGCLKGQKFDPTSIILEDPELWQGRLKEYGLDTVDLKIRNTHVDMGVAIIGAQLMQHGLNEMPDRLQSIINTLVSQRQNKRFGETKKDILELLNKSENRRWVSAVRKAVNVLRRQ
ncbi:hypothetical protein CCUS01_08190 [Colletotrichum cuscutae]|uniref:Uncharacterized protein n=1 Tax=Colletotrichum cuscutae TaxID=1209917 RepID=A0AAI9XXJ8_9PEZI|nr:hypothetical protein CCUS01_08190 [Colletotrichum cuscutae]